MFFVALAVWQNGQVLNLAGRFAKKFVQELPLDDVQKKHRSLANLTQSYFQILIDLME